MEAEQKPQVNVETPKELQIEDQIVGSGPSPKEGQTIRVHYEGRLENGKMFDSSRVRGEPIEFTYGMGQVIPGWEYGLKTMKVGGKRSLIIPPELGYGSQGAGNAIPPNATLYFNVELVEIVD